MKIKSVGFYIVVALTVIFIIFLATGWWRQFFHQEINEEVRPRIITVLEAAASAAASNIELILWEENLNTKIPMDDAETVVAVLNKESEGGYSEEQFILYRTAGVDSQIFLTFLSYDERTRSYRRMWNVPTAASRSETVTIFSQDLIGDRNNCIIVTGMNNMNEHTITIFRRNPAAGPEQPYRKIAELQIDGSIVIQETTRSLAYQQGMTSGQSFNIAAYGHDISSANILDQIETIYSYNPLNEQYEQIRVSSIPGSQIESRRIRELLSGTPGVFEEFINDLWYYVSPQGTIDTRQYIYFDHTGREIIFYGDDAQQVFLWQSSSYTRYGLYVRSQNISINTLLRFLEIELETLDSIRLRVNEDVRLRITANTTWDGSYRRAGIINQRDTVSQLKPAADALYDSSWGRVQLESSGEYTINSGGNIRKGRYVFYNIDGNDLLEFRPEEAEANRLVYKIENAAGVMLLSRVRVGVNGIQDLLEPPITFTPVVNF